MANLHKQAKSSSKIDTNYPIRSALSGQIKMFIQATWIKSSLGDTPRSEEIAMVIQLTWIRLFSRIRLRRQGLGPERLLDRMLGNRR
ncbi:hypothetical protein MKK69_12840 [Methylobacterium sp. J-026]|uniref:hypothetical protein n=1 Tax=Methylobacterium sp. J-026 TaxID=2836624 RepID=UPI001FBBA795|nr:hypothetical protein [Methylobacterium sp. J-026]MCJ2134939.1 hypothetical protein [Methylobacterium sp. J-026]